MLTPLDIENKRFSKQMMNGYSVEEVDEFLDEIGVDYAKKNKELLEVSKKVEDLNKDLERYRSLEDTLQNTLVMAQSTAEEVKNVAKQQADQIIKDAEGTARQSVENLSQSIIMKKKELEDLDKQLDVYRAKMESLLISQLELIKDAKKDN
jgi:cell division initiation protein